MNETIKVAIADTNSLFSLGVKSALSKTGSITIAAVVASFQQLREILGSSERPDVLIMNLSFAEVGSFNFLTEIISLFPSVPVIAMGMVSEEIYAARILRAGGAAYLKLDCTPEELVEAVKVVKSGRMYLTSKASNAVIEQLQNRNNPTSLHTGLSDREYQIFTMICRGVPLVRIGQDFGISVKTVSTYRARILKKMNMQTNADLILYAVKNQIIEPASA